MSIINYKKSYEENIFNKLTLLKQIDEINFLNENVYLRDYFYDLLINIKNNNETKVILCKNSYERRFVHILANSLELYHSRYGDWSDFFKKYRDYQEKIDKIDGIEHYKIIGVKVSIKPIHLSKRDKINQITNFKSSIA